MTKKKSQRQVKNRLLKVLKSRQMVIAASTIVVALLILAIPELKAVREELLTLIITLALAAIGSYTVQDTTERERSLTVPREELREMVEDVLSDMVDERIHSEEDELSPEYEEKRA